MMMTAATIDGTGYWWTLSGAGSTRGIQYSAYYPGGYTGIAQPYTQITYLYQIRGVTLYQNSTGQTVLFGADMGLYDSTSYQPMFSIPTTTGLPPTTSTTSVTQLPGLSSYTTMQPYTFIFQDDFDIWVATDDNRAQYNVIHLSRLPGQASWSFSTS
jgi:uncharacterized membrane protein